MGLNVSNQLFFLLGKFEAFIFFVEWRRYETHLETHRVSHRITWGMKHFFDGSSKTADLS